MDIPDLVQQALDGEEIQAGVSLGDEDAVCLTPTRTLVYRGDGLLSDEQVSEFPHDVEQLAVSESRRKTKFTLQYIDGTDSFTVPAKRGEKVLELLLEGVLRLEEVIEPRESILGVYRFSELTVIVAEGRLIKHIGEPVWNEDFEVYDFEDVTGLEFERASVATSITLAVDGRPQRIKVPNDTAPVVRQTLEKALFEYYEVDTLEDLNRVIDESADTAAVEAGTEPNDATGDFEFGDDFDPLVSDEDDDEGLTESVDADDPLAGGSPASTGADDRSVSGTESEDTSAAASGTSSAEAATGGETTGAETTTGGETTAGGETTGAETTTGGETTADAEAPATGTEMSEGGRASAAAGSEPREETGTGASASREAGAQRGSPSREASAGEGGAREAPDASRDGATGDAVTREEFEAVAERLDDLTEAVERQNELLRRQHRAIKQLVRQHEDER